MMNALARSSDVMAVPDPMHLFRLLGVGELQAARLYFAGTPHVADQLEGVIRDADGWQPFAKAKSTWLRKHRARLQPLALVYSAARVVGEATLHMRVDGKSVPLPIAFVADVDGDRWSALRVYHSTWPVTGKHLVRAPLLKADPRIVPPGFIGKYHDGLRSGDLEAVLSSFGPNGYMRQSKGGEFVAQGREQLHALFAAVAAGGTRLDFCTLTDDGVRTALEYNLLSWGGALVPPQAGLAVYERGPGGLLTAVRLYDDIETPA
ncbi:MAG TPA: hypothetical protein VF678_15605 [bacterium]